MTDRDWFDLANIITIVGFVSGPLIAAITDKPIALLASVFAFVVACGLSESAQGKFYRAESERRLQSMPGIDGGGGPST